MSSKKSSEFYLKEEPVTHSQSSSTLTPKEAVSTRSTPPEFRLYKIRWVIWVFFTASMAASGLAQLGLAPINAIVGELYGVGGVTTSMLILPFTIFFIPLIFPANYLIENYGIRIPVFIASVTLVIGAWIRILVNYNFYFLVAGQWIMAIGQPFVLSTPAKLAGVWFGDKERAIATTLGSLAAPLGAIIGYLLPLTVISDSDVSPGPDQTRGQERFFLYLLIQSAIITLLGLPISVIIRNAPPTPPSASAANVQKQKSFGMRRAMVKLLKNVDFIWMMIAFSAVYTIYTTLGAALGSLTGAFNYDSSDNSLFGSIYVVGGVVGSFIHAIFLDKYARFKLQYIIIGILNWISFGLLVFLIDQESVPLTAVLIWFMGFSQLPILGVSYSFWAELTYPINEALSCGLLQLFGSIVATSFTFLATSLITNGKQYLALYILLGLWGVGLLWKILVREILKKKRAGIRGTIFSFHFGNQNFRNSYFRTASPELNDQTPLVDQDEVNRIE